MEGLSGHPDSGAFWEQHCDKALKSVGFVALEDVPFAYFHKGMKLLLTVYVDDFKMAGPTSNLEKGWRLVGQRLRMDPPTNMGQYLGCMHRPFEITVNGKLIRGMEYDMEEYLRTAVRQYGEVCLKVTGKTPKLNSAVTPFYPDSPQHNRASIHVPFMQTYVCKGQPTDAGRILCNQQDPFEERKGRIPP